MIKVAKNSQILASQSEPIPKEKNVPAVEVNITVIQAAIDDRFKKNEEDIKNTNTLVILGFFVLLVMVATIVVMVVLDYKNSSEQLHRDQFDFLNFRLEKLEQVTPSSTASSSGKTNN